MGKLDFYHCDYCNEWSSCDRMATLAHLSRKHYVCPGGKEPSCWQRFNSREQLIKHWVVTQHRYYCHLCDGCIESKEHFVKHTCKPRHDAIIGGYRCPVCKMMAPTLEVLDQHFEDTAQDSRHFRCNQKVTINSRIADHSCKHMQVHRPATIPCYYCGKQFCSHYDLFCHMEVACRGTDLIDIHKRLLAMDYRESCALETYTNISERYFCRGCDRRFSDLGSLPAHMEQSSICPAHVQSEYFRKIVAIVNWMHTSYLVVHYASEKFDPSAGI